MVEVMGVSIILYKISNVFIRSDFDNVFELLIVTLIFHGVTSGTEILIVK